MNNYTLEDLTVGNFDPSACFKFTEDIDVKKAFDYPFEAFCNNEGSWDINGKPTTELSENEMKLASGCGESEIKPITRCSESEIKLAKTLLQSKLDETYYIQEGTNDYQSWFILGKIGSIYVYFEAACDYTGFDCRGGGTFGYTDDWKTLWNMRATASFRNLVLTYYGYQSFKFGSVDYDEIQHGDREYIEEKLKTLNKSVAC